MHVVAYSYRPSPIPSVACECYGLGATPYLELAEDHRHVIAHGLFADVQACGDFVIVEALGNDFQDFSFARREIVKKKRSPAVGRVRGQEIAERTNELLPRRLRIQNET